MRCPCELMWQLAPPVLSRMRPCVRSCAGVRHGSSVDAVRALVRCRCRVITACQPQRRRSAQHATTCPCHLHPPPEWRGPARPGLRHQGTHRVMLHAVGRPGDASPGRRLMRQRLAPSPQPQSSAPHSQHPMGSLPGMPCCCTGPGSPCMCCAAGAQIMAPDDSQPATALTRANCKLLQQVGTVPAARCWRHWRPPHRTATSSACHSVHAGVELSGARPQKERTRTRRSVAIRT